MRINLLLSGLIGLMVSGGALIAHASNVPKATSAWDLLVDQHQHGHEIAFTKEAATYVGRCYEYKNHELAIGSAVGFYSFDAHDGPLFPPKAKKVIYGLASGYAPESLDGLDKDYLDSTLTPAAEAYTTTKESPVQFSINLQPIALDVHVVANGAYLYLLAYVQADQTKLSLSKGDIFNACYYFIKK